MITPISQQVFNQNVSKITKSKVNSTSFGRTIEGNSSFFTKDYFEKKPYERLNDALQMRKIHEDEVLLRGRINDKVTSLKYVHNPKKPKGEVEITGYFDGDDVNLLGFFKNKYKCAILGTIGDKRLQVEIKKPIFGKDRIQGIIAGEEFCVKFPNGSANTKHKDLIFFLLNTAGYNSEIIDDKFSSLESSNTCYKYFNGGFDEDGFISLFDDIWEDPIFIPFV